MIIQVPLFKQTNSLSCGPTALRMVLAYFGYDFSEEYITGTIGGLKKYGVRAISLRDFASKLGFKTTCFSFNKKLSKGKAVIKKPKKDDILNFIKKGIPVIVAVRYSILYNKHTLQLGHFIVITAFESGVFCFNDPRDGKEHKIAEDDFLFAWHNNILDSSAYLLAIYK